jgi:hypothetical protein
LSDIFLKNFLQNFPPGFRLTSLFTLGDLARQFKSHAAGGEKPQSGLRPLYGFSLAHFSGPGRVPSVRCYAFAYSDRQNLDSTTQAVSIRPKRYTHYVF